MYELGWVAPSNEVRNRFNTGYAAVGCPSIYIDDYVDAGVVVIITLS